jgi:hypothetical protein
MRKVIFSVFVLALFFVGNIAIAQNQEPQITQAETTVPILTLTGIPGNATEISTEQLEEIVGVEFFTNMAAEIKFSGARIIFAPKDAPATQYIMQSTEFSKDIKSHLLTLKVGDRIIIEGVKVYSNEEVLRGIVPRVYKVI